MNIHNLMNQFAKLDYAIVGQGAKNLQSTLPDFEKEVEDFLSRYSFLYKDEGYVDFLKLYAGAMLDLPNGNFTIDIFGFDESVSMHLTQDESQIVDDNGYFTFCSSVIKVKSDKFALDSFKGIGYSFDATGNREWGIYRIIEGEEHKWYCDNFLNWLKIIITSSKEYLLEESLKTN